MKLNACSQRMVCCSWQRSIKTKLSILLMATSMGTVSCFGMGLAVGATKGGAGMMDVITGSSDGDGHCDVLLFDDDSAVATFSNAGFEGIWVCTIFFNGGEIF